MTLPEMIRKRQEAAAIERQEWFKRVQDWVETYGVVAAGQKIPYHMLPRKA